LQQDRHAHGGDADVHQRHAAHAQRAIDAELDDGGRQSAERHADDEQGDKWQRHQSESRQPEHRAQHDDFALGEVQDPRRADDHRETERNQAVDAADGETSDREFDEMRAAHEASMAHKPLRFGLALACRGR